MTLAYSRHESSPPLPWRYFALLSFAGWGTSHNKEDYQSWREKEWAVLFVYDERTRSEKRNRQRLSWTNPLDIYLLLQMLLSSSLFSPAASVSPLQAQDPGTHQHLSPHMGCWCLPGLTWGLFLRAHFSIQTQIKAVLVGSGHSQAVPSVSPASFLQRKPFNFFFYLVLFILPPNLASGMADESL